jgi:hypothetical protein
MLEASRVGALRITHQPKGELVITITINTDNAAFEDNPREMAELLERLANYYRDCEVLPDSARDSNGNTVCHITQE